MNIQSISSAASYRLEEYTDDAAGAIVRMVPVSSDGASDPMRVERFTGKTFMQTDGGPIEMRFAIDAHTLTEAFEKWGAALRAHMSAINEVTQAERIRASIIDSHPASPMQARQMKKLKP